MSQTTHKPDSGSIDTEQVTRDDIYEMLGNQRRRYALHYLERHHPDAVEVREVSDHVAAWENAKQPAALSRAERKRVQTALHQFHLPKLDEAGLVEYDEQRREVSLTGEASDLRVFLDVVPGPDVPWSVVYLGLVTVSGLVLLGATLGAPLLASLTGQSWSLLLLVSIGITAIAHTYVNMRMQLGRGDEPPGVSRR